MLSLIFNCVESLHVAGDEVLFIKASMKVRGFSNDMYNLGYYKEKKLKKIPTLYFNRSVPHRNVPAPPRSKLFRLQYPIYITSFHLA